MNLSKALVVDDSKVVRVMFKRMLEARGLGVETAASGQEALEYLTAHAPDVIFMDYMMTGADGYEVTAMIVADPRTSTIPVIMCTANDTPKDRARADGCGAIGFLTKPIGEAALDALLLELREGFAPRAAAGAAPIPAAAVAAVAAPVAAPAEDTVRVAERIAREVTERLLGEAIAVLSATSEQATRDVAQAVGAAAAREVLATWRAEAANTSEHAENAAMGAAERVARTLVLQAAEEAEAARKSTETAIDERLREALAAVSATAERIARETLESARAELDGASRQVPRLGARGTARKRPAIRGGRREAGCGDRGARRCRRGGAPFPRRRRRE